MSVLPARICAVLFDKDGTLVDFDRTWAGTMMAGARDFAGGDEALALRLCEAVGWDSARATFAPDAFFANNPNAAIAARWRALAGKPFTAHDAGRLDAIFARAILGSVSPLGDLAAVVARLRARGLVLGVATNDSRVSAEQQLLALGVGEAFVFVTGYDGPCPPKPDPTAGREFARLAGCRPEEIAVVGDSDNDMQLARAGGAFAVAVTADEGHRAVLAPLADVTIGSIDEL
jgi:phosphoglycolate phosphatase